MPTTYATPDSSRLHWPDGFHTCYLDCCLLWDQESSWAHISIKDRVGSEVIHTLSCSSFAPIWKCSMVMSKTGFWAIALSQITTVSMLQGSHLVPQAQHPSSSKSRMDYICCVFLGWKSREWRDLPKERLSCILNMHGAPCLNVSITISSQNVQRMDSLAWEWNQIRNMLWSRGHSVDIVNKWDRSCRKNWCGLLNL